MSYRAGVSAAGASSAATPPRSVGRRGGHPHGDDARSAGVVRTRARGWRLRRPGQHMLPRSLLSCVVRGLEHEAHTQLHGARRAVYRVCAYSHEVRVGEPRHRVAELRVVEHILRLGTDLDAVVSERDCTEHREVEVPVRRSAERVAPGIPPCVAWLREEGRVVPRLVRSRLAEARLGVSGHVDRL